MTIYYESENKKFICKKINRYTYSVYNNNIFLGQLRHMFIGKYLHWTYCPPPIQMMGEFKLTNGIIKNISYVISLLYKER